MRKEGLKEGRKGGIEERRKEGRKEGTKKDSYTSALCFTTYTNFEKKDNFG